MMLRTPSVRHDRLTRLHNTAFLLAAFAALASSLALAPDGVAARGRRGGGKAAAAAPHGKTKVGVAAFTGPGEAASRAAAAKALSSKKIVVVSGAELGAAAKQLHVRLDDDSGFKAVAKSLNLTAIVQGEVSAKKATLTIRTGQDGTVVGEESFAGNDPRQVAAVIGKTFWKRLAGAFNKTNPPGGGGGVDTSEEAPSSAAASESEPSTERESAKPAREEVATAEPERKPAKKTDAEAEEGRGSRAKAKSSDEKKSEGGEEAASEPGTSPWFDGSVGLADLMRSLSYNQQINYPGVTRVANYSLPQSPVVLGKFDIYPGAMLDAGGFADDIGLTVDLAYLLPVVTTPGEGGSYKTASLAWAVGPKVRLPAGFFATVAYGDSWFKLVKSSASMNPSTNVPLTDYKYVRIGGGIRRQVSTSLSLMANLAYDRCLGTPGGIGSASYFPKTTCAALEAGAGAGYRITNSIELRAGVDLRRFGLAFNTTPNDAMKTPIAGGAVDQYIQLYVAVAYLMGGGGTASGGDAESADTAKDEGKAEGKKDKAGDDEKDDDKDEGDGKDE